MAFQDFRNRDLEEIEQKTSKIIHKKHVFLHMKKDVHKKMGSEQIHFEALRKQMIMDRRNAMNIQKKLHVPPYQPYYVPYELPQDDIYVKPQTVYEAKPTVSTFTQISSNEPWKFMSMKDIHGNSSASLRRDGSNYQSAKIPRRYKNNDYLSQW